MVRVSPSGRAGLGWGGGRHRENVYTAYRGYVVVFATTLMIQPQALKCSRQFQLIKFSMRMDSMDVFNLSIYFYCRASRKRVSKL